MKFVLILLIAAAAVHGAPVEESAKAKRGLALGYGYHSYHHAPLVTHSHYVAAPAVVHHAPLISHAPLVSHAPIIAHHPVSFHLPSYHTIHHFK